jgi:hypothetical protein
MAAWWSARDAAVVRAAAPSAEESPSKGHTVGAAIALLSLAGLVTIFRYASSAHPPASSNAEPPHLGATNIVKQAGPTNSVASYGGQPAYDPCALLPEKLVTDAGFKMSPGPVWPTPISTGRSRRIAQWYTEACPRRATAAT